MSPDEPHAMHGSISLLSNLDYQGRIWGNTQSSLGG
jgi:hypothetical protein